MRYFVLSEKDKPFALVCHDYRRGSYVCRSTLESIYTLFEACVNKLSMTYDKSDDTLYVVEYSPHEYEWSNDLIDLLIEINPALKVSTRGETSGSDLSVEDLVQKYLV